MSTTTDSVPDETQWSRFFGTYCEDAIHELVEGYPKDRQSLYVEARDLLQFDTAILDDWLENPLRFQRSAEEALRTYDLPVDVSGWSPNVRLTDSHGTIQRVGVSDLNTSHRNHYVAVTGDLARITGKKPRLAEGAFRCERCEVLNRITQLRTSYQEPHQCRSCERQGPFRRDDDESEWRDQRKIKLEQPIEDRSQSRGQSVPCFIEGDLCEYSPSEGGTLPDHTGDRATVLGVVRLDEAELQGRNASPETNYWIDAKAIVIEDGSDKDVDVEEHREAFETWADRDDALDAVAASIAPSIHSPEDSDAWTAKQVGAAWLFNAYRMDHSALGSKRGDFHVGIFGDPGVGKSTIMADLDDLAPKSEFRSGDGGITEAGLTSAATQEEFAGVTEWTLEPGILPRADGGHCLIDEIDAVVDSDTKAIHDALEGEQMVKVDKAGIEADLPTRSPVLLGGNPEHTRFDKYQPIPEQIDIDAALFDRLDIVLAVQDTPDEERDANTADHVLDTWGDLTVAETEGVDEDEAETSRPISKDALRSWVAYAREHVHPTITDDRVQTRIKDFYTDIRDLNDGYDEEDAAVPATVRTLEACVRVSIAIARLHLSEEVQPEHADRAIELCKQVVGLRFDPDTGEFDADRHSGTPQSQRERIRSLTDLVDELCEEYGGAAPEEAVIDRATDDLGMSESKAQGELDRLKHAGELYEPANETGVRTT